MKPLTTLMLVCCILFISSCDKPDISYEGDLLVGTWKTITDEEQLADGTWFDYMPQTDDCEKDNLTIFKADRNFEYNEGATKCSNEDPHLIGEGKWSKPNASTVRIKIGFETVDLQIDHLDQEFLILSKKEGDESTRTKMQRVQ